MTEEQRMRKNKTVKESEKRLSDERTGEKKSRRRRGEEKCTG